MSDEHALVDPDDHPILYRAIERIAEVEEELGARPVSVTIPQADYIALLAELKTLRGQWQDDPESAKQPDVLMIAGTTIHPEPI